MFNIGDKVRVKDNFWEIADNDLFLVDGIKKEMSKAKGKVFTVGDKTMVFHLLIDEDEQTDGFAWEDKFLELV